MAKEKIKQAIFHFDKAGEYLTIVSLTYKEEHPEISIGIEMILQSIIKSIDLANTISDNF